jgi:hypothetical protein
MMTCQYLDAGAFARTFRAAFISCVLLTLVVMQSAVLMHAFEHFVSSAPKTSTSVSSLASLSDMQTETVDRVSQNDSPARGGTCQKCLEDVAHTFVLPGNVHISHIDLAYEMFGTALPHNVPFLSPERANQRGPPLVS